LLDLIWHCIPRFDPPQLRSGGAGITWC
jgi:hypothetical protein